MINELIDEYLNEECRAAGMGQFRDQEKRRKGQD